MRNPIHDDGMTIPDHTPYTSIWVNIIHYISLYIMTYRYYLIPLYHKFVYIYIWVKYNDLTVLPNPGIMVKKGNHSQMAQEFRLGKYYNLPRSISYTIIIFQYTIIIHNNTICFPNLLQYVSLYHYPTRWGFLWVLLYMFFI